MIHALKTVAAGNAGKAFWQVSQTGQQLSNILNISELQVSL
jgi:hypothetical protein